MTSAELAYGLSAALANVLGAVAVAWRASWGVRVLDTMLSFAAGFLISVSLIDLYPHSLEVAGSIAPAIVLGAYVLVHLTQHTIGRHFHFGEETHSVSELIGVSALVGLLMHTFVDGVAVASGLRVSPALGALVFFAVLLHKFPEGLAISSLFLAAGARRRTAILAAAALGVSTIAGLLLTDELPFLRHYGLAISAGVTMYVAASNLVPELQDRRGLRIPLSFVAGCGLYLAARTLVAP
ncbi:MAG TPA: ZIP family metal transporter [Gemmatimonadaceae bacterium]|nr:ZIP family metal transporter [Gemmatimonadaceae bacterium]